MKLVPKECRSSAEFDRDFQYSWQIDSSAFGRDAFEKTLLELIECPERSSTAILRAEILEDNISLRGGLNHGFKLVGTEWSLERVIHRKLLPRNPRLDQAMLQKCYFFSSRKQNQSVVLLQPSDVANIPFYHPQVKTLAFHYCKEYTRVASIPLPPIGCDTDMELTARMRLDRTMYQLVMIVAKHSSGHENHYVKRVVHDLVVPKHEWQDLYTELKGRLAQIYMSNWAECTDPRKHVFEDLGIAAFLISLHRQLSDERPRETISFADIGCGNGLLVDILLREGYSTCGFDARARKSWNTFSTGNQLKLCEMVLYPSCLNTNGPDMQDLPGNVMLSPGIFVRTQFLIGNHADELTPYIPLLAALATLDGECSSRIVQEDDLTASSGFMIIPCCTYTFSGGKHKGLSTKGGRYESYLKWLIEICEAVGWIVEREALRIPSTRNHALVGRKRRRVELTDQAGKGLRANAQEQIGATRVSSDECPKARLLSICREVVARNGGMQEFLDRGISLTTSRPRAH